MKMKLSPEQYAAGRSICDRCRKGYYIKDTTARLSQDADSPLFVQQVIQYFAEEYGQSLAMVEFVCVDCVQDRWDKVLEENSFKPDSKGHFILNDNDEFFGRREDEEGGMTILKKKSQAIGGAPKQGPAEVTFVPYPNPEGPCVMTKGDYKGKQGMVIGQVRKGWWDGLRVRLSHNGKEIDVQPKSFDWV